jgi:hypothetical protein
MIVKSAVLVYRPMEEKKTATAAKNKLQFVTIVFKLVEII